MEVKIELELEFELDDDDVDFEIQIEHELIFHQETEQQVKIMDFIKSLLCFTNNECQPPPPPPPPACAQYRIDNVDKLVNYQGCSYRLRRGRDIGIPHMWMNPSRTELGQPTVFHAYFDLSKLHHYNIVWFVGLYRDIRKSDHKFVLQNDEKSQTLFIISVDNDMYGRVHCEIRQFDALKREFLMRVATSNLIVMPLGYSQLEVRDEIERRLKRKDEKRLCRY